MTTSAPVLFTSEAFASHTAALSAAIVDAAKARGKVAAQFRDIAAPAYGDKAKQSEVAELLAAVRRAITDKRESYAKWLASNGRASEVDAFKTSVIDQVTYAGNVAGKAAGCAFKYDQKSGAYAVADLPAPNEPSKPSAQGKDENSAEQAAAIVAAATASPEQTKAQRLAHLDGVLVGLLNAGYSMAEIESAFHGMAAHLAKGEAEKEIAASADKPQAPAILADKLAENLVQTGRAKPAQRKRA